MTKPPYYTIPPDTIVHDLHFAMAPQLWHLPPTVWDEIWENVTGKSINIAILDTGCNPHNDLPDPVSAKSFIRGQDWTDPTSGHGCIHPDDEIYTSNCGLQKIKTMFDRMSGIAHFLKDGSIIKDISRYNIFTFSLDTSGNLPKVTRNRVTHVHKLHHDGEVYEIEVNGEKLTLTPWHPVYCEVKKTETKRIIVKKRADELTINDRICLIPKNDLSISEEVIKIPYDKDTFIDLNEDLAMWLGLVITDGHITKKPTNSKGCRRIEFCSANIDHINLFVELTSKIFKKTPIIDYPKDRAMRVLFNSVDACNFAERCGVPSGNKSKTVDFPELIAKSPRNVIEAFFAGVIEGDGCISNDRIRISTASTVFAEKICKLLGSLGIKASRCLNDNTKSNFGGDPNWVVRVGYWPEMLAKLRVKDGSSISSKNIVSNISKKITNITKKLYNGDLYDFTVEGSHNYVANGLVVSNTHVAGTSLGRNGIGVAPGANLIVGKVLSNGGSGSSTGIAEGIRWAVDQGADVISMSLGGGDSYGPTNEAIDYAWSKGCVVNAAAGNSGYRGSNTIGWPAKYVNCICNGATRSDGSIANFSSGGRELDWATPGENIISCSNMGGYRSMSGSSMSTPFGSGLLALIIELMRREGSASWTAKQSFDTFIAKFTEDAGKPGKDDSFGHGIPRYTEIVHALRRDDITWV